MCITSTDPLSRAQNDPTAPIVVIGLGNPGNEYTHTRHNIGFAVVDKLAEMHHVPWRNDRTIKAQVAEIRVGQRKVLLAKPTTYVRCCCGRSDGRELIGRNAFASLYLMFTWSAFSCQ
jgi:hypothetical protein